MAFLAAAPVPVHVPKTQSFECGIFEMPTHSPLTLSFGPQALRLCRWWGLTAEVLYLFSSNLRHTHAIARLSLLHPLFFLRLPMLGSYGLRPAKQLADKPGSVFADYVLRA